MDWAAIHKVWLGPALTEPNLVTAGYPLDDCASLQQYQNCVWQEMVDLWVSLNRLLLHVLAQIPENKLMSKLIERYVEHCQDIVGQMLAHL